jgi:hypothetical protein
MYDDTYFCGGKKTNNSSRLDFHVFPNGLLKVKGHSAPASSYILATKFFHDRCFVFSLRKCVYMQASKKRSVGGPPAG